MGLTQVLIIEFYFHISEGYLHPHFRGIFSSTVKAVHSNNGVLCWKPILPFNIIDSDDTGSSIYCLRVCGIECLLSYPEVLDSIPSSITKDTGKGFQTLLLKGSLSIKHHEDLKFGFLKKKKIPWNKSFAWLQNKLVPWVLYHVILNLNEICRLDRFLYATIMLWSMSL